MSGRIAAGVAVAWIALTPPAAFAGTSPWVGKANAVCRAWQAKSAAILGANPKEPSTSAGLYRFIVKARPLEIGELHALQSIRLPSPPDATRAFSYVTNNIVKLDEALVAYRAGNRTRFLERAFAWQTDNRASRVFRSIGATACP